MLRIITFATATALSLTSVASAQNYPWKPDKPITLIVPWAAGGSTDQVSRVAAAEIEKALGQKVVVVNQGGASAHWYAKCTASPCGRLHLGSWRGQGSRHLCRERNA